jgi:beta-galactosidase
VIAMMDSAYTRDRIDLGGTWQLAFDPDNRGIGLRWAQGQWPDNHAQAVRVPSIWNRFVPDAEGVGFYRTSFTVPDGWSDRLIELCFAGASYAVQVWLNGEYIGHHEGAYTSFRIDITEKLSAALECELVVRVAALSRTTAVDGMVLTQTPASKQSWYYANGGLWGEVTLEARPRLTIDTIAISPDLVREVAEVDVALLNRHNYVARPALYLQVEGPDGSSVHAERLEISVPPGRSSYSCVLPVRRAQLWTCQDPHLYRLHIRLMDGKQQIDEQVTNFGMRSFRVRDGEFFLNDVPTFIKGVLLQPNYPITDFAPPTPDMMVREVELMKAAGFNLIRAHVRPAPPGYLDITDRLGMLVYAESSMGWIRDSPRLLDHCKREMRSLIERDRNHPSVVIWGIQNENPDVSGKTGDAMIREVRSLDQTRVIVDHSGGSMAIDQDYGWLDRATAVDDRATSRQRIEDVHLYLGSPIDTGIYSWLRGLGTSQPDVDLASYGLGSPALLAEWTRGLRGYRGKVYVSELGCGGMADLDEVVAGFGDEPYLRDAVEMSSFRDSLYAGFLERHLDEIFGTVPDLIRASQHLQVIGNVRQVEALMCNPRVSGFGLCQLNDVAWEFHAGILDHWRNPKPAYEAMTRLNQPHCIVLRSTANVIVHGDLATVAVTLVQRSTLEEGARITIGVYAEGKEVQTTTLEVGAGVGIRELGCISFPTVTTDAAPCEWKVVAQLLDPDGVAIAETHENILSMPLPQPPTARRSGVTWLGPRPSPDVAGDSIDEKLDASDVALVVAPQPGLLTAREWDRLFDVARYGGHAIIGPLEPGDEVALRALDDAGVSMVLHFGIGNWMGCYHWTPESDLFRGVPAGGFAGEPFAGLLPRHVMSELGGKVLAGSFRNTQTRQAPPAMLWYSDIEQVPFAQGSLTFCQYNIFDSSHPHPIAARMRTNLLDMNS